MFDCCNTTTIPTCENHFLITVLYSCYIGRGKLGGTGFPDIGVKSRILAPCKSPDYDIVTFLIKQRSQACVKGRVSSDALRSAQLASYKIGEICFTSY